MDDFQKLQQKAYGYLLMVILSVIIASTALWTATLALGLSALTASITTIVATIVIAAFAASRASKHLLSPMHFLWQAILHVAPDSNTVAAPNMEKLHLGHALVTSLAARVYQFASQQDSSDLATHRNTVLQAVNVVSHFPLPVFIFNKEQLVTNASESALNYLGLESPQLFGRPLLENVHLEFPSEHTLQDWITDCQTNKVTDQAYWERVKVHLHDGTTFKQCDLAAYYNRDNQSGTEFIVTFFDKTAQYQQDEDSLSFVALAVHELRTPLTMLRGYIEVFEEELTGKVDTELADYMRKMRLSADQLTAFVNNILNVVRVEEKQLSLHLVEGDWPSILTAASANMQLRAQVLGKIIKFNIQPGLPKVAVDPVSISEVVNNLLDNAVKYSVQSQQIIVTAFLNQEGMVETTVQDFGVGIPGSVLPNLFEKFYRNHRTRAQIGGTGLGLYLTKALVTAHGGQVWVKSKEGEGTTFGFTLKPYSKLADELKHPSSELVHQAHGWIKNHSYNRR